MFKSISLDPGTLQGPIGLGTLLHTMKRSAAELTDSPPPLLNAAEGEEDNVPADKLNTFQKNAIWLRMQKYKRSSVLFQEALSNLLLLKNVGSIVETLGNSSLCSLFLHFLQEQQGFSPEVKDQLEAAFSKQSAVWQASQAEAALILNESLTRKLEAVARSEDKQLLEGSKAAVAVEQEQQTPRTVSTKDCLNCCNGVQREDPDQDREIFERRTKELQDLHQQHLKLLQEVEELRLKEGELKEDDEFDAQKLQKLHQKQLSAYQERIDSYKAQVDSLQRAYEDSLRARKDLSRQIEQDFTAQNLSLLSQSSALEKEVARMRQDRDKAREVMEQFKKKLERTNANLGEFRTALQYLQVANQSLLKQNAEFKLRLEGSGTVLKEQDYMQELETVGKAFDQLSQSLSHFEQKIEERDGKIAAFSGERTKLEMAYSAALKEKELAGKRAQEEVALLRAETERLEGKSKALTAQLMAMERDSTAKEGTLEAQRRKISELQTANQELAYKLEKLTVKLEHLHSQIPTQIDHTVGAAFNQRRLEEELAMCRKRLAAFQHGNGNAAGLPATSAHTAELQQELEICKKLLRCPSCNLRQKDVALAKCMHVFCRECVDCRLETRQRKCPVCLESFGASDVRPIYL